MRSTQLISMAFLAATSSSAVIAHGLSESFDTSILDARAALPNTVPMAQLDNSSLKQKREEMVRVTRKRDPAADAARVASPAAVLAKRGDDGEDEDEDCEEDEDDDEEDEDDEDCDDDTEDSSDSSAAAASATLPTSNVQAAVAAVATSSSSASASASTSISTPSNLADQSFTPAEGCIRYHTVLDGEVCLGVLDGSKDLGLTLDQFYCLNPGINEDCANLQTGEAYCTGYGGDWPDS